MTDLQYPFEKPPEFGATLEVAPGVYWLRMPLPMALDHINLYLLEDDDGWWIVDTGMKWGKVKDYWQEVFDHSLKDKPIKGVIVTHMHPDHVGQAGWLCDRFQVPLLMTHAEYYQAHFFASFSAEHLTWSTQQYYRRVGLADDFFITMKRDFKGYAGIVEPIPSSFQRLQEGDVLTIAQQQWRVVIGSGHSPEHACLYCEALGVMLSGDQIIPKITSNVSVMPSEPEANPLLQWLNSLQRFMDFPADTLVLPAHNTPFVGIQTRVEYLMAHHQDHLLALEEACVEAKTAHQLLPVLFKRELDNSLMMMAMGECVAHLNYLIYEHKLSRTAVDGVDYYLSIDASLQQRAKPGKHRQDDLPIQV
ncbi:MBL fold metallo-hydrolase [Oceanicoccus sagamiensis]|uniref:Metallo-beta-lactamase domain-containing protein n=1 Tax=Oceanicoccus sagamiensis TaxID=716816 RepID=A0A1X9NCN6_9GAMM|nr:MBL fold metallo-hydrolase [Oceanicoccus sagamiensis]ARN75798.1 hypothetical protein BST96_17805 [Oceanicoccus sagamiensis]